MKTLYSSILQIEQDLQYESILDIDNTMDTADQWAVEKAQIEKFTSMVHNAIMDFIMDIPGIELNKEDHREVKDICTMHAYMMSAPKQPACKGRIPANDGGLFEFVEKLIKQKLHMGSKVKVRFLNHSLTEQSIDVTWKSTDTSLMEWSVGAATKEKPFRISYIYYTYK